jgi:HEAT repeat protein
MVGEVMQGEARERYLRAALRQYGVALLPAPDEGMTLALEPIYQPLRLRQTPLVAGKERQGVERDTPQVQDLRASNAAQNKTLEKSRVAAHAEEALAHSPEGRIVILGAPGSGKTTTLHRLATVAARRALANETLEAAPLPLYLTLPGLAASGSTLEDAAAEAALALLDATGEDTSRQERDAVASLAREAAKRRDAILLLDGLDEVEPGLRGEMIARLNAWAASPGGVWIVGSRFTEYKGGQFTEGRYSEWELLPLDRAARLELARRLLPMLRRLGHIVGVDGSVAQLGERLSPTALVDALEERPQTRPWAENPLLLSLAALVYARDGALPAHRAGLYSAVIEAALAAREPDASRRAALRRRLAKTALRLFQQRGRTFTRVEALAALAEVKPSQSKEEATRTLWQVARAGLIEAPSMGPCAFRHLTFQEYLAGEALADGLTAEDRDERTRAWDMAWSKRLYSRWTEPLRLMTGALGLRSRETEQSGPEAALRWVRALLSQRGSEEGDPGGLGFALAARCVSELPDSLDHEAEASAALTATQRAILDAWLRETQRALAGHHDALTQRANEVNADIGALPEALINPVIDTLLAQLRATVQNDGENYADFSVIVSLKSSYALSLVQALLDDPNDDIARRAATDLAHGNALTSEQVEAMLSAPIWHRTLSTHIGRYSLPIATLIRYVNAPDWWLKDGVIAALGKTGDEAAIPYLIEALRSKEWQVCQTASQALLRLKDRVPLEPLIAMLDELDERQRNYVEYFLTENQERTPADVLWRIATTQTSNYRAAALAALACQGNEEARQLLLAEPLKRDTLHALSKLPNPPLNIFDNILRHPEEHASIWHFAAQHLAQLAPGAVEPLLIEALSDPRDANRRTSALRTLSELGSADAIENGLARFHKLDASMRKHALELLAAQARVDHLKAPTPALLAALTHVDRSVRTAAINTCHFLSDQGMVFPPEPLLAAVRETGMPFPWREQAINLLKTQNTPLPTALWLDYLASDDVEIVKLALKAHAPADVVLPDALVERLVALQFTPRSNRISFVWVAQAFTHASREALAALRQDTRTLIRVIAALTFAKLGEPASLDWIAEGDIIDELGAGARSVIVCAAGEYLSDDTLRKLVLSGTGATRIELLALLGRNQRHGVAVALEAYQRIPETADRYWERQSILSDLCHYGAAEALEPLLDAMEMRDTPSEFRLMMDIWRKLVTKRPELQQQARARIIPLAQKMLASVSNEARLSGAETLQMFAIPFDRAPFFDLLARYDAEGYDDQGGGDDPIGTFNLLVNAPVPLSLDYLAATLHHYSTDVRAAATKRLAERVDANSATVIEQIAPLLADSDSAGAEGAVAAAVYIALRRLAPEKAHAAIADAEALLLDNTLAPLFGQTADHALMYTLRYVIKRAIPSVFAHISQALASPHWNVRLAAIGALQEHHRNVPDDIIRQLYALRYDRESARIRSQADKALAAILSLETGMEDA